MTSVSDTHHREWRFLTSHTLVLLQIAGAPEPTVREIADRAGLTERQTHRVLDDLVDGGYVERTKHGRRNRYRIDQSRSLRAAGVSNHPIGSLLTALTA